MKTRGIKYKRKTNGPRTHNVKGTETSTIVTVTIYVQDLIIWIKIMRLILEIHFVIHATMRMNMIKMKMNKMK